MTYELTTRQDCHYITIFCCGRPCCGMVSKDVVKLIVWANRKIANYLNSKQKVHQWQNTE